MVGYIGEDRFGPCRRSHYYRRDAAWFDDHVVTLAGSVSAAFRHFCPGPFLEHSRFAAGLNPSLVIPGTVFTTLTVNVDARTALHKDKGNFGRIGCMAVFGEGFGGCDLLVPEHDLAFVVREGDLLIFDVTRPHCNSPLAAPGRISVVFYMQRSIERCAASLSRGDVDAAETHRARNVRPQKRE
jgi:hypothetical protein